MKKEEKKREEGDEEMRGMILKTGDGMGWGRGCLSCNWLNSWCLSLQDSRAQDKGPDTRHQTPNQTPKRAGNGLDRCGWSDLPRV